MLSEIPFFYYVYYYFLHIPSVEPKVSHVNWADSWPILVKPKVKMAVNNFNFHFYIHCTVLISAEISHIG